MSRINEFGPRHVSVASIAMGVGFCLLFAVPDAAEGQLSSDIPGITSASIPSIGGSQRRIDFQVSYYPDPVDETRDRGATVRLGYGRSFRVLNNLEAGLQFSFADVGYLHPADRLEGEEAVDRFWAGHLLYGLELGMKYRPISFMNPEGEGIEAAVFFTVRPGTETGMSVIREGDSTWAGGLFRNPDDEEGPEPRPLYTVPPARTMGVSLGYRSRRLAVDGSIVLESGNERENPAMVSHSGFSPRLGARYRLTPGFAGGFTFWSTGSAPWQGEGVFPGMERGGGGSFGVVLTFGAEEGAGTDLILSRGSGNTGEPVRLFIRGRRSL